MRNDRRALSHLLTSVRYEVIPTPSIADRVREAVPTDVTMTVTASPAKGLEATLELAELLTDAGYRVVPHIAARLVTDQVHLKDIVERLVRAGIEDVFIPAGDADPPVGQYDSAVPLLRQLSEFGRPFARVGIAGYPESHPVIEDDVTIQSMWDKRQHATYIVSNLCFDPRVLAAWVVRLRRRQVLLPVYIGLAGPVDPAKLLAMATKIGVGPSTRFLTRHPSWFARLALPGGYTPEPFLRKVVRTLGAPGADVSGLHIFTFNQVAQTERWRQEWLAHDQP